MDSFSGTIFSGYDPEAIPLQINVIAEATRGGVTFRSLYFTGELFGGAKSRIFAVLAFTGKNPPLLHLGDSGDGIDYKFLARYARDYTVLAPDNYGLLQEGFLPPAGQGVHSTVYPETVRALAAGETADSRHSMWFRRAANAMRSVFLLLNSAESDGSPPVVYASGTGCHAAYAAGLTGKIKSILAYFPRGIFACGGQMKAEGGFNEQAWLRQAELSYQTPAQRLSVPSLILTASNSAFAEGVSDCFARQSEAVLCITPRQTELPSESALNTAADWLKNGGAEVPSKPRLTLKESGGVLYASIFADGTPEEVIFYTARGGGVLKNWQETAGEMAGEGEYIARIDIFKQDIPHSVFANIRKNGLLYSSRIAVWQGAGQPGAEPPPERLVYEPDMGAGSFAALPPPGAEYAPEVTLAEGPFGIKGVRAANAVITYKPGDPKYLAPEAAELVISLFSASAQDITLCVTAREDGALTQFYYTFKCAGAAWQKLTLAAKEFKNQGGRALRSFPVAEALSVYGATDEVLVSLLLWA